MDILLIILGIFCIFGGIIGSFLPVIPGPPISWLGLLLLHLTDAIEFDGWFITITGIIAAVVVILDYVVPAAGTKKFGGTKGGVWGSILGLIAAIIFPVLGFASVIVYPFIGALIGELLFNPDKDKALKAAFGSFVGFLIGTLLKFILGLVYGYLFFMDIYDNWAAINPF